MVLIESFRDLEQKWMMFLRMARERSLISAARAHVGGRRFDGCFHSWIRG